MLAWQLEKQSFKPIKPLEGGSVTIRKLVSICNSPRFIRLVLHVCIIARNFLEGKVVPWKSWKETIGAELEWKWMRKVFDCGPGNQDKYGITPFLCMCASRYLSFDKHFALCGGMVFYLLELAGNDLPDHSRMGRTDRIWACLVCSFFLRKKLNSKKTVFPEKIGFFLFIHSFFRTLQTENKKK